MSDLSTRCRHALARERHKRAIMRISGSQIGADTAHLADSRVVLDQLRAGDRIRDLAVVHVDDLEIIRRFVKGNADAEAAFERLAWGVERHDD